MAPQQDEQGEGIALDDGTWVDVGRDGRWHPSAAERIRAGVILGVAIAVLALAGLALSLGGGGEGDGSGVAAATTTQATEATTSTTSTTGPQDPASIDGEPTSEHCVMDDRGASPYRERDATAVLVLNATSRTGHAAAVAERLEALGYATTVPGNGGRLRTSVFRYIDGYCAEAVRLAFELGLGEATFEPVDPAALPVPLGRARIVATVGADTL